MDRGLSTFDALPPLLFTPSRPVLVFCVLWFHLLGSRDGSVRVFKLPFWFYFSQHTPFIGYARYTCWFRVWPNTLCKKVSKSAFVVGMEGCPLKLTLYLLRGAPQAALMIPQVSSPTHEFPCK